MTAAAAVSILTTPTGVTVVNQVMWLLSAPVRLLLALLVGMVALVGYRPRHAALGRYSGRHLPHSHSATTATVSGDRAGGERW